MSKNRVLVACGVIAAAAVSMLVRSRRPNGGSSGILEENEPATAGRLPAIDLDDDQAAEIISRARPALDRAAKLL